MMCVRVPFWSRRKNLHLPEQESGQDAEAKATADTKINNLEYIVFFNCICLCVWIEVSLYEQGKVKTEMFFSRSNLLFILE